MLLDNKALDAVHAFNQAPCIAKVKERFRREVEPHGYTHFMCTAAPEPQDPAGAIIFEDWPGEWRHRYGVRRYHLRDPMIQEMCRTAHPFTWADALDRATYSKADRTIVHEASAWGMRRGFVVPIYGVGGEAHAITMAGDSPLANTAACATLYLLSLYAHGRANRLKRGGKEKAIGLRPRECEVLLWVAAGKSDWEIGEILHIGASTVHKHVESAKRKFGVRTRVQAVVAALRQGHIRP